ncbi:uncharacterized protein LOC142802803 [Rhipicephalus microplus]|uniref:uncharacterized protein LOC142802803 n=1 Tax=Rhipicephalus microplus TaxID=6941 RepID=UPI003F6CAC11
MCRLLSRVRRDAQFAIESAAPSMVLADASLASLPMDSAGPIKGISYLVVVDAHSKWPEVCSMTTTTSEATIACIHELFCRFGFPETLVSDNGSQFISAEFRAYLKHRGIRHVRTAPYHPSSNGLAERFVQTLKSALRKISPRSASEELADFLLAYRNTPHATTGEAPSTLLLGRRLRTRLDLLRPAVENRVRQRQFDQTRRHPCRSNVIAVGDARAPKSEHTGLLHFRLHRKCSRHSQDSNPRPAGQQPSTLATRPPRRGGDAVRVRNVRSGPKWLCATVLARTGPVSYRLSVVIPRGVFQWVRHQNHIRNDNTGITTEFELPFSERQQEVATQVPTCDSSHDVDSSLTSQSEPADTANAPSERRYPQRQRRPPDRFVP